mgnify:CR=1 FL=1
MHGAGPPRGADGHDRLAPLLLDLQEARRRLDRGRHLGRAADQQALRQRLLGALEAYAGALAETGAPLPYRLRREIDLLRGLTGQA